MPEATAATKNKPPAPESRISMNTQTDTKRHFIFTALAENQSSYFLGLARELKKSGHEASILLFHEGSVNLAEASGIPFINVFDKVRALPRSAAPLDERFARLTESFGIQNANLLFSHEKMAFGCSDETDLKTRFCNYLEAIDRSLDKLIQVADFEPIVIQETGGFFALTATFYAARRRGIHNVFMEPAIFPKRIFMTLDTFGAPEIRATPVSQVSEYVKNHLAETVRKGTIVIPQKDSWRYANVIKKIFTTRHVRRLVEKSVEKYVLGRREEYSHIGHHVKSHLQMILNWLRMRPHYSRIPDTPFIYFPLHVPADLSLTVRSPEYLDQMATLEYLARVAPSGYRIVTKEHPALVGAIPHQRILEVLQRHQHVSILEPTINNFEVMKKTSLIVTINSKTGAEGLMCHRNTVVLGDAFYTKCDLVTRVHALSELGPAIRESLAKPFPQEKLEPFFQNVYDQCYPGEIYVDNEENYRNSAQSIVQYCRENVFSRKTMRQNQELSQRN